MHIQVNDKRITNLQVTVTDTIATALHYIGTNVSCMGFHIFYQI